jgi:hypothetical protein
METSPFYFSSVAVAFESRASHRDALALVVSKAKKQPHV